MSAPTGGLLMGEETKRLSVLEARVAIADLVHRYALHVREGRGAACGELFTEDGAFEVRKAPSFDSEAFEIRSRVMGRAQIAAYVNKSSAPDARVCPMISNLIIDVNGATAQSSCVMTTLVISSGEYILGAYRDSFRYDDSWRFTSRIFTIVGRP